MTRPPPSCAINGTDVQEGSSAALGCTYTFDNGEGVCGNANAEAKITGTTCFKDGTNGLPGVKCGNTAMNPDWTCTIGWGATSTITQSFIGQDRNDTIAGAACTIAGTDVQEGSSAALGCAYSFANGEGSNAGWNANADASVTGTTCFKDGTNGLPGVKCGNHAMNPDWTCTISFGATITNTFTFTGQDRNDAVTSVYLLHCRHGRSGRQQRGSGLRIYLCQQRRQLRGRGWRGQNYRHDLQQGRG